MRVIAVSADHAGEPLMGVALEVVRGCGAEALVLGRDLVGPQDDYPDFAGLVAEAVRDGAAERGVLLCGSGVGAAIAACKFRGVRACVCHDTYTARQGVEHDDMNVLCLGARVVGSALARELMSVYLDARFTGEERHVRRLGKIRDFEGR